MYFMFIIFVVYNRFICYLRIYNDKLIWREESFGKVFVKISIMLIVMLKVKKKRDFDKF